MSKEYVVYEGSSYLIEWYYDERGRSMAFEYYQSLSDKRRRELLYLVKRMGDTGAISNKTKFNYEGDKIYAFKPQPHRFLCFFYVGSKIVITNAFCKKQQKLPANEKDRALKIKKDYESRVKNGEYYG